MKVRILLPILLLFLFAKQEAFSQMGFSHEIGVILGPVLLYSDYGERGDFETNTKNMGFGIGLVHYLNFAYSADCNCYTRETYFNDHFKVRNELDFHRTNLKHYGKWVSSDRTSRGADQLRAMSGSSSVIEIGTQLEYYPLSIRDFDAGYYKVSPFFSLGVHYVNFNPEVRTPLGIDEIKKFENGIQTDTGSTFAMVGSVGIRYKLTKSSDLMLDSRWVYYFSDYVDGLNPIDSRGNAVPENKSNDWLYWLNIGYVYYLD